MVTLMSGIRKRPRKGYISRKNRRRIVEEIVSELKIGKKFTSDKIEEIIREREIKPYVSAPQIGNILRSIKFIKKLNPTSTHTKEYIRM